jgi:two-component system sensor histidine kinase/response regulator
MQDSGILNTRNAIARLGDNQELYQRLLLLFRDGQSETIVLLRAAMQQQNMQQARLIAHNLKGNAGAIGADALVSAAKELEKALIAQETAQYAALQQAIEFEMARVMNLL